MTVVRRALVLVWTSRKATWPEFTAANSSFSVGARISRERVARKRSDLTGTQLAPTFQVFTPPLVE